MPLKSIIDKQVGEFIDFNDRGTVIYLDGLVSLGYKIPVAICNNCGAKFKGKEAKKMMFGHIGCPKPNGEYLKNMELKEFKKKFSQAIAQAVREREEKIKDRIGLLRQWLNEKPRNMLVKNKDIEIWLFEDD